MLLRQTHLILDREKLVIGVLVGQPRDQSGWKVVQDEAYAALNKAADDIDWAGRDTPHRRGAFGYIAHGISYGTGQTVSIPSLCCPWYSERWLSC